jgi:hypothetical protein
LSTLRASQTLDLGLALAQNQDASVELRLGLGQLGVLVLQPLHLLGSSAGNQTILIQAFLRGQRVRLQPGLE